MRESREQSARAKRERVKAVMFVYVTVFAPGCRWLEKRPESIIQWHFTQKCTGYAHHPHPVHSTSSSSLITEF